MCTFNWIDILWQCLDVYEEEAVDDAADVEEQGGENAVSVIIQKVFRHEHRSVGPDHRKLDQGDVACICSVNFTIIEAPRIAFPLVRSLYVVRFHWIVLSNKVFHENNSLACYKADPLLCFHVLNSSPQEVETVGDAQVDAHQDHHLHDVGPGEYQPPPALLSTAALMQFQMMGLTM